jgi:hypothetical protein
LLDGGPTDRLVDEPFAARWRSPEPIQTGTTRTSAMTQSILCIVPDAVRALNAISDLRAAGFPSEQVSMLFPDRTGTRDFTHVHGTKAPEGAVTGASAGGLLGGGLGWLVGIGSLAVPGAGVFIAAGPLMAALSGAALGAMVGGLAGGCAGLGVPEFEARQYAGRLRKGTVLLSVLVADDVRRRLARDVLLRNEAQRLSVVDDASVPNRGFLAPDRAEPA